MIAGCQIAKIRDAELKFEDEFAKQNTCPHCWIVLPRSGKCNCGYTKVINMDNVKCQVALNKIDEEIKDLIECIEAGMDNFPTIDCVCKGFGPDGKLLWVEEKVLTLKERLEKAYKRRSKYENRITRESTIHFK